MSRGRETEIMEADVAKAAKLERSRMEVNT
jgi:hypothetical protein